jgi:hypothetical protein
MFWKAFKIAMGVLVAIVLFKLVMAALIIGGVLAVIGGVPS